MGLGFRPVALTARDKKTLLALTEQAQLVYLLTRYPRKQVLDDPADVDRLEKGLDQMRASAAELSAALRDKAGAVPWEELAKMPDSPDLAWRRAKRVAPTVLRELMPLLEGEPEAAFFLRPEAASKATRASSKTKPDAKMKADARTRAGAKAKAKTPAPKAGGRR